MFNFFMNKNRRYNRNLIYNMIYGDELRSCVLDTEKNIVIDVRNENEYNSIHVQNAINIPVGNLRNLEREYMNKEKIIIYCSTGTRTKEAIRILNSMGYNNLYIWDYGSISNFPFKDMLIFHK